MSQAVDKIMRALEQRAGIDQSPEGRLAFWIAFSHLRYEARIKAGAEELRRRVEARDAAEAERRKRESAWW